MPTVTAFEPVVGDPLRTKVPLDHEGLFYRYGFPVRIRSNSAIPLNAAAISYGTSRQKFDAVPLDVRIIVAESSSPARAEAPIFRSQGNLMTLVIDAENFASLDLNTGFGFGWVTRATAETTDYFRQCFLDVITYCLLEIRHLVTIHSACVRYRGVGVLLAGFSGAGKSSLAYACARRGWTYVSDDMSVFRRCATTPVVIGHPQNLRFRESAGQLFPEFAGLKGTLRPHGKPSIEVRTESLNGFLTAEESSIDYVVLLNRQEFSGGTPLLLPVSYDVAWERLSSSLWAVQLPAFEERVEALRGLLKLPIYEIRYGALEPAIDLLETLAEGLKS